MVIPKLLISQGGTKKDRALTSVQMHSSAQGNARSANWRMQCSFPCGSGHLVRTGASQGENWVSEGLQSRTLEQLAFISQPPENNVGKKSLEPNCPCT